MSDDRRSASEERGFGLQNQAAALQTAIRDLKTEVRINESLARHTTARLGGPADILIEAGSADELRAVVIAARSIQLPITVLGGGANVLVSDAGVRGLTIINKARRLEFREGGVVWCESGVVLPTLARACIARGLSGLEWAVGVPGTVGGAVVGNAGAHGRDTAADLQSATVLTGDNEVVEWIRADLQFGYRGSRIKSAIRHRQSDIVVLAATFQLTPADPAELEKTAAEFSEYRRRTQPPGASLGSMFKNPPGDAAGRLIDQCGLKGAQVGDAEISTVHANFFVNHGRARAADVKALIDLARAKVRERCGVELELEIELVGEW